ncbi:MAG: NUDIX hydrolase [Methylococcaceae bacterium]
MAFRRIKKKLLRRVDLDVRQCVRKGTHRPTVGVVLEHAETGRILIVNGKNSSVDGSSNPGIIKGGVQKRERVLVAAAREIFEELGISKVVFKRYCGSYSVTSLKQKDGFLKKRYFVFHAVYTGPADIACNLEELSGYSWVEFDDVVATLEVLRETRFEKYEVLISIFAAFRSKKRLSNATAPSA